MKNKIFILFGSLFSTIGQSFVLFNNESTSFFNVLSVEKVFVLNVCLYIGLIFSFVFFCLFI